MRTGGTAWRRAVAASVGVHALLAAALVCALRWQGERPEPSRAAAIDTRTEPGPRITFSAAEVSVPVGQQGADAPRSPQTDQPSTEPPPAPPAEPTSSRPEVVKVPDPLPPGLRDLVKRPPAPPAPPVGPEVVEVPVTPAALHPVGGSAPNPGPAASPPVRPAGGSDTAVSPVHGALAPGQAIVYVLDASGSMGEAGKFDLARRSLLATLRAQPETVRFQVVVYSASARPLFAGGCVAATAENVRRAETLLASLDPAGRSSHAEGVRAAVALRPDFVLILTDADELPSAKVRGALGQATKPVTACVAKVTAGGIGPPAAVK